MLLYGARLALGSDFPVESQDPRLGLYAAVTRQDLHGDPEGGWLPGEKLNREEALRGFTLDAAYSLALERELGSLEVGKRADLVVFAGDIMSVAERDIPRFLGLYKRGKLPVERLRSGFLGLAEINQGFDRLAQGSVLRQILRPNA